MSAPRETQPSTRSFSLWRFLRALSFVLGLIMCALAAHLLFTWPDTQDANYTALLLPFSDMAPTPASAAELPPLPEPAQTRSGASESGLVSTPSPTPMPFVSGSAVSATPTASGVITHASVIISAATPMPTRVSTPPAPPTPTPAAQASVRQPDLFDELIQPFVVEAGKRRAARARADATYYWRIDPDLNRTRINFLLFGYGETNEPPLPPDIIGSITILSYDVQTRQLIEVSLTHDARAPEIERYAKQHNLKKHMTPSKIDWAYRLGGFDLMRLAVENATGLSIDFQVALKDVVIKHAIDDVLGDIEVDNPFALSVNPIYIEGKAYAAQTFGVGRQKFDGSKTMSYLKGLALPPYDPAKENNHRKQYVFKGVGEKFKSHVFNPLFSVNVASLVYRELERKNIEYDFDISALFFNSLRKAASNPSAKLTVPTVSLNVYLVDAKSGDGGFVWLPASGSPIIQQEFKQGLYQDKAMAIPWGRVDPNAQNLAAYYWFSVRGVLKRKMLPPTPTPTIAPITIKTTQ
jgi:anionic cell wall polymer biosynthesis LytR-Cps2A-Psr (LCP) family protein